MKFLSKVVWSEGMYLGPHHFQVQNRYFEDSIRFATSSVWFEPHGFIGYQLDAEALRNGTVGLIHARGILPDGLLFQMPESDPLPAVRAIADVFPPTRDFLTVLLAVPTRKQDGMNCAAGDSEFAMEARYVAENQVVHDDNTGREEKPVQLGRKNIRFLLDTEDTEGMLTMPLARVLRDGTGHFIYDPEFIPACVRIGASETLMLMLQRLVEILEDKSTALSRGKKPGAGAWAEYSTRDIASFWMLHAVNSAIAPLRHQLMTKRGHPEELYVEMARLGGALCTFAIDSHPRAIPLYDHNELGRCFQELDRHIRKHLEAIVPTNCLRISLEKTADYFYAGQITDQRVLDRSRWVLAIGSPAGEVDLITKTPQIVKICSEKYVAELVKRALPGLALTHLPVPPSAVSAQVDMQYFSVDKVGPCWDSIVKTREIGVYVPGDLPDTRLELLVVLES